MTKAPAKRKQPTYYAIIFRNRGQYRSFTDMSAITFPCDVVAFTTVAERDAFVMARPTRYGVAPLRNERRKYSDGEVTTLTTLQNGPFVERITVPTAELKTITLEEALR